MHMPVLALSALSAQSRLHLDRVREEGGRLHRMPLSFLVTTHQPKLAQVGFSEDRPRVVPESSNVGMLP